MATENLIVSIARERRLLQQTVATIATLAAAIGLYGILFGHALTGDRVSISADSHFRFLSGLLFGIGICFLSTIPSIEIKTGRFRLLTVLVMLGGIGRFIGLILTGLPSLLVLGGLFIELIVTPVLCLWQTRIANRYAEQFGVAD